MRDKKRKNGGVELQKDSNDISISLAVIASIQGTHCHISIVSLTDKQTNKQILTATKNPNKNKTKQKKRAVNLPAPA